MEVIEPLGATVHVPFAYHSRGVTCLLKQFAKKGSGGIDAFSQLSLSVLVAVKTCYETGATGGRQRVFYKGRPKQHATACQTVDVGRRRKLRYGAAVCTDGLHGVVVTHYI